MLLKLRWMLRLGLLNLIRVAIYRVSLKSSYLKYKTPIAKPLLGPFFQLESKIKDSEVIRWKAFSWIEQEAGGQDKYPNWHQSVLNNKEFIETKCHWSDISDFSESHGDIKGVWENSRWDWLWLLAFRYRQTKNTDDKSLANNLLTDWSKNNPANQGPNWKCGQEASLRVLHLALAAYLFDEYNEPSSELIKMIQQHLKRIAPTMHYAIGQDNNHGTSEAAALFVGGSWLTKLYKEQKQTAVILFKESSKWESIGRFWLEERINHLIESDGSFSQYSMNYHRLMLDSLSVCEFWRSLLNLEPFSVAAYVKIKKACEFIYAMCEESTGFVPNIGHNDGANLFPIDKVDYSDYRTSINFAYALFYQHIIFESETSQLLVNAFNIQVPTKKLTKCSKLFEKGGYTLALNPKAFLVLKFPHYRFRPAQSDALHLDLFLNGENLLRDAGTYSYNTDQNDLDYFGGTEGHNTVQFDNRQQMPRISRFLWGSWLTCQHSNLLKDEDGKQSFSVEYTDWKGAKHKRTIELLEKGLVVTDTLSGNFSQAVLRWRLAPYEWKLTDHSLHNDKYSLSVFSKSAFNRFELVKGFESRYYALKTEIPVLEIGIESSSSDIVLTTEICW